MSLEEWQSKVTHPLQNLLNLASARPNVLTQLAFVYRRDTGDPKDIRPVEVVQHLINPGPRDRRVRAQGKMLFKLSDVPFTFESSLTVGLASRPDSERS